MLLIKNGMLHDAIHPEAFQSDILIEKGKITHIAPHIPPEAGWEIFDADGLQVYPGFVDVHTHIGMFGHSGTSNKDDVEKYDPCVPQNRIVDAVNPMEDSFQRALQGGVTCVCVAPGSVNCIGGTALAMKTFGRRIDDMIVKNPVAMKIALGENPKDKLQKKLTTRMTAATSIRNALEKARCYMVQKDLGVITCPDPGCEALIPVLKKEIPLKAHAHRCDDIFTAIRLAKEFDLNLTLEHCSDSYPIADILAQEGYPIAAGPYLSQPKKEENRNGHPSVAVALVNAGCQVSLMTDAPIISEEYLSLCAGLLMREGLSEFQALQTITIHPAKHLGIEDRVGSLSVGKDADIVISRGCAMEITGKPLAVFVSGQQVVGV